MPAHKKYKPNTSGLKNQPQQQVTSAKPSTLPSKRQRTTVSERQDPIETVDKDDDYGEGWDPRKERIGMKPAMVPGDDGLDEGEELAVDQVEGMHTEEMTAEMIRVGEEVDAGDDGEWLSTRAKARLRRKLKERKGQSSVSVVQRIEPG